MVQSKAATVAEYLRTLPPDRRADVAKVRQVIRKNLPRGYREGMGWGMITYHVPLAKYADTGNGQPLCYAALAAQKNYISLYLMTLYADAKQMAKLKTRCQDAGKKLDMGKSCIRFKRVDDLPLDVIAEMVASTSVDAYVTAVRSARATRAM